MNSDVQGCSPAPDVATTVRFLNDVVRLPVAKRLQRIRYSVGVTLVAFLMPALLCLLSGSEALRSFLADFGAQSRFFFVLPLLILGEPSLVMRLDRVAVHFLQDGLLEERDRPAFDAAFLRFTSLRGSLASQIAIIALLYAAVITAVHTYAVSTPLLMWMRDKPWIQNLSPAALWYFYISLPMIGFFLFRAVWCQFLWAVFMHRVARLDLRLIASHPDRAAGLGFVQTCLKGYYPLALAIGTILAGGVANRVVYGHASLASFEYMPFLAVSIVVVLCVTPLCAFMDLLWRTRNQGTLAYSGLVLGVGREFEKKWVSSNPATNGNPLAVQDFSATTDLYSIAANIYQMAVVPFAFGEVLPLLIASLFPAVPVILVALPLHVVLEQVFKFFF